MSTAWSPSIAAISYDIGHTDARYFQFTAKYIMKISRKNIASRKVPGAANPHFPAAA